MPKKPASPPPSDFQPTSREEWAARTVHQVELDSGAKVLLRFATLGQLITAGALSERLLELALLEYASPGTAGDLVAQEALKALNATEQPDREAAEERAQQLGRDLAALNRELIAAALVEPKVTAEQLADPDQVPPQDFERLSGLVNRTIAYDAAGRRMGVEPLDTFATFCHEHRCPPDCPACEQSRRALSTIHPGEL